MSKFYKLRKNTRLDRYKSHVRSGHIVSDALKNRIPSNSKLFSHDDIKPFEENLFRSKRPLTRFNSQFHRLDEEFHSEYSLNKKNNPLEFKAAILEKFRKSDKLALSLFRTIEVLDQEINSLKQTVSQKTSSLSENSSNLKKNFDIDLLTDQFVGMLKKVGIIPKFTSPAFVYLLENTHEINTVMIALNKMSKGGLKAVGLDVETASRNHFSSFPSILQIAINKNIVIILQLCFQNSAKSPNLDLIPGNLKKFLASPSILKVGVSIRNDANQLQFFLGLAVSNTLCLQDIGNILSLKRCSLKRLSKDYLGMQLYKGGRQYDWDAKKDSFQQRSAEYAANDVISSLLIFRKMISLPNLTEIHKSTLKANTQSIKSSAKIKLISYQTRFTVKAPAKLKSPSNIYKPLFLEIVRRIVKGGDNKPISYAKLAKIIRCANHSFPKDGHPAKVKPKNIILHLVNGGVLVKKLISK